MRLDVRGALKNPGQSYPIVHEFNIPEMEVLDETIWFEGVRLDGEYIGTGESVRIEGAVSCKVHAHCAKCLEPVEQELTAKVGEVFTKTPDESDPDQYPLDGTAVELDELVRDALLLALPLRFLCKIDCKGLCPECGQPLNHRRCTCQEGRQSPFSALRSMLNNDEEV